MPTDCPPSASSPSQTYNGSCHCSRISFTVTLSPPLDAQDVTSCNCSICARNGYLLVYVKDADVKFSSGEKDVASYSFANKHVAHQFCPTCGTSVFASSNSENFFPGMRAVNVRAFHDVDIDSLKIKPFDGKSLSGLTEESVM